MILSNVYWCNPDILFLQAFLSAKNGGYDKTLVSVSEARQQSALKDMYDR